MVPISLREMLRRLAERDGYFTLAAAVCLLLALVGVARSEEHLQDISPAALAESGRLLGGQVVPPAEADGREVLRVEHRGEGPQVFNLFVLDEPPVAQPRYAIRGEVRYQDVDGEGYLEMWNYFADGGHYFTRTLGGVGLLQRITGTSGWRKFALPFRADELQQPPNRLEVNLVLAGSGTVELRGLSLVQYAAGEDPLRAPGQWWGERTGGLVGGIGGGLLGCLGGLIGLLAGRSRGRRFVMFATAVLILVGAAALLAGVVAVALGQPYAVYYPLLLGGVLLVGILAPMRPKLRQRYEEMELRQIAALDA
jgi:hypothetical protein